MLKSVLYVLALFLVFSAVGCGTMANLEGKDKALLSLPGQEMPKPFGGVGRDFRWLGCAISDKKEGLDDYLGAFTGSLIFVTDLPFSLVGDVVTLPRVLALRRGNQATLQDERTTSPSSP